MVIKIFFCIIIICTFCILIPLKIKIKINIIENKLFGDIVIFIFRIIPIYKIKLDKLSEKKIKKSTDIVNKKIKKIDKLHKLKFELNDIDLAINCISLKKLDANIGVNFSNQLLNVSIINFLNIVINMYIGISKRKENIKYIAYISKEKYKININSIINFKFVNTIYMIIQIVLRNKKGGRKKCQKQYIQ